MENNLNTKLKPNSVFNSKSIGIKRNNEIINALNSLDLFKNNPIYNNQTSNKQTSNKQTSNKQIEQIHAQIEQISYLNDNGASGDGPNL